MINNKIFEITKDEPIKPNQESINNFKSIYKSSGFFLLKDSIINQNEINLNIDLDEIKQYDNSLGKTNIYEKGKKKLNSKENFIKDSFYSEILSTNEKLNKFKNLHNSTNFKLLQNEDKSNSSIYFNYLIINNLENDKEIKNIESNLYTLINSITDYKKENISIISRQYKYDEMDNDYKYYRRIKPNGNSFYISFIYQYFKNLIINSKETTISHIFNIEKELSFLNMNEETSTKISYVLGQSYIKESPNQDIDFIKNSYFYLYMIYKKTINKKIDDALRIFDYSFCYEETFNELLCMYMRLRIKRFISINKDVFTYEKYCQQYKLISEDYYDKENKDFLYEIYINENVVFNKIEPNLFIISIVPFVFDINLNLYINQQSSNIKEDSYLCDKISLNENQIMINILYSSFSYHIIEKEKDYSSYTDSIDISNILNITRMTDIIDKKKNYIFEINGECKKCHNTKFIKLININKNEICLNCLKNSINEVFEKRYSYLLKEEFNYIEYYLRDIPLIFSKKYNNYINLNSAEFYFLFNSNIYTYFKQVISKICDICGKYNKKLIRKKCGCKRCKECAKNEINNNLILNYLEENYIYINKFTKCACGKELNEVEYRKQLFNILNDEEKRNLSIDSKNRNNNYIKIYCMFCGYKLKNNETDYDEEKPFSKYIFININGELKEHLICNKCNKNFNKKEPHIRCIICQEEHTFNIEKDNKINKVENEIIIKESHNITENLKEQNKKSENDIKRKNDNNKKIKIKVDRGEENLNSKERLTKVKNSNVNDKKGKIGKVKEKSKVCKKCIIF